MNWRRFPSPSFPNLPTRPARQADIFSDRPGPCGEPLAAKGKKTTRSRQLLLPSLNGGRDRQLDTEPRTGWVASTPSCFYLAGELPRLGLGELFLLLQLSCEQHLLLWTFIPCSGLMLPPTDLPIAYETTRHYYRHNPGNRDSWRHLWGQANFRLPSNLSFLA